MNDIRFVDVDGSKRYKYYPDLLRKSLLTMDAFITKTTTTSDLLANFNAINNTKAFASFKDFPAGTVFTVIQFFRCKTKLGSSVVVETEEHYLHLPERYQVLFARDKDLQKWNEMENLKLVYTGLQGRRIVLNFEPEEYFEVVKASLDSYHPNCSSRIAEATQQLDRLIKTEAGRKHITKLFLLCTELQDELSVIASFFRKMANQVSYTVQNDKGHRKTNNEIPPRRSIEYLCDIMTYPNASALDLYAAVFIVNLVQYGWTCLHHDDEFLIEAYKKTDIDTILEGSGERQWFYQTCTEFGYYQRLSTTSDIFGIHLLTEQDVKLCEKVFGPEFNETRLKNGIYRTNTIYGGMQVNVGNIIFVHGSKDPWHPLGITRVESENSPYEVVFINGMINNIRQLDH
ncbi:putative serine protease K12H4.7 [Planococcus citri]|uniref:putative serine protease K12H4.7 n=1 Tax=Planococcus citri TaxID=170843 RepID=UPI0031F7EE2F